MKKEKRGKGKRGAMQFAWIFAIIVGGFILFLTFFFLGREIFVQEQKTTTEQAHGLDILLGPFSYLGAIAEATSNEINFFETTNLAFDCNDLGLGYSDIIVIGKKQQTMTSHDIHDKYIYAQDMETKKITVISKPFKMPFRIADLIYLADGEEIHCFVNAPLRIENELSNLDVGIEFYNSLSSCPQNAISICFDVSAPCDVKVYDRSSGAIENYEIGEVRKGQEKMYFASKSLMYAAIFSNQEIYECNLNRIMTRQDLLVSVYREKARALSQKDCEENYGASLSVLDNAILNLEPDSLSSIVALYNAAQQLDNLNSGASCSLY